jgi:ubiquinone/menaquinone biosynthesis C-methylase UbiE
MQQEQFFKKEGDSWFERNREAMHELYAEVYPNAAGPDVIVRMMEMYGLKPKKVLEVGASNGYRLALIADKFGSKCVGIDPSAAAVKDGNKNFPKIKMLRGVASDIPLKEKFDVVIMNLALQWVSREELLKAVAELDRMVKDGGHLIIGDFLPDYPMRVLYHHKPTAGIYTYKLDYAEIFIAAATYRSIARLTHEHSINKLTSDVPMEHRCVASLLKKSLNDFYFEAKHTPRANLP